MSVQDDMLSLKSVNTEIARLQGSLKKLKDQAKVLQNRIITYLDDKKQKGVKLPDDNSGKKTGFVVKTTTKTLPQTQKERNKKSIEILKGSGVSNPEKVLEELLKTRKGEKINVSTLKIIQTK
jgi:hypothetical protein